MRDLLRYVGHVSPTNCLGEAAVVVLCVLLAVGGRSGMAWDVGEWSLLEVEVPPLKDGSRGKDMAIIEELSQQICWSSIFFFFKNLLGIIFRLTWKKATQTETKPSPTGLKSTPQNPPKLTNQPYPQTEATFPSISSPFVRSTRWSPWMNHSSRRRPRRFALRTLPLGRNVGTAVEGGSSLVGGGGDWAVAWLVGWFVWFVVFFYYFILLK